MDATQQDQIAQFSAVTGANPSVAQTALASANWNLEQAVALYFAQNEEAEDDVEEDDADADESRPSQSNPQPASSSRNARGGNRPKQMTLQDLQRGDDDEEEDDKPRDLFAGGEKSGLAVQNPDQGGAQNDHFRNIMNQARQNRERPPGADDEEPQPQPRSSNFAGPAQTLGGDDAPSRVVQDPAAAAGLRQRRQAAERVTRTLHLWADGVSIDDGPLLRFDDPQNEHIMQEINQGRAPKALLDVEPDQEVDLNLEPHKGENYVAPKPKYKPFGGSGQRLGSPTPGLAFSSTATASSSQAAPSSAQPKAEEMAVDESQPTVQMQIRLGDGTRLSSRFNTTHTIGDIYEFITRAQPQTRAWVLQTTFPPQELTDKAKVLGEMNDFKRGGVVVQKWK